MIKLITFYLPQFHRIPENDEWWGKGFTEWVNVKRAKPLYHGHYQPREPLNDNYYDLSDDRVMEGQMKLAKKYGIYGFCFYHYWFGGKKMLEMPVERLLENKKAVLPFCLAWANEDWMRTWQGIRKMGNKEILIKQQYGEKPEWEEHFNYLLPFFKDKRYIKESNKPMLLIYRSNSIRKCNEMLQFWDGLAMKNGFDGMYFIEMQTYYGNNRDIKMFSAKADFEPSKWRREETVQKKYIQEWKNEFINKYDNINLLNRFFCRVIDYDKINKEMIHKKHTKNEFRGVFVNYDDTARKGKNGTIVKGSSPKKFEIYLTQQIKRSMEEGNPYLFINAWNEWGEGNYLEPDKRYGYAYLHAIRRALESIDGEKT